MLKHNEIIQKLTPKQKIALVCDLGSLSDPLLNELGVPAVSVQVLEELLATHAAGLSASALSRAWNPRLIEALTQSVLTKTAAPGAHLVITPSPKMKYGKDSVALSEDGYLSSVTSQACLSGTRKASSFPCVDNFSLCEDDVLQMDEQLNRRTLMEYFVLPFRQTVLRAGGEAVMARISGAGKHYSAVNRALIRDARPRIFEKDLMILCRANGVEETLDALQMGCILVKGVPSALEAAYDQYLHLKNAMEQGSSSAEALEEALVTGSAISDEMLDEATDRVLSFAHQCAAQKVVEAQKADWQKTLTEAYAQTAVLLKNENKLLPIGDGKKIALIGADVEKTGPNGEPCTAELFAKAMTGARVGSAPGYSHTGGANEELIAQALSLVEKADVAFVFLSLPDKSPSSILPANQIALLDALSVHHKKIVGVLTSDRAPNMQFTQYVSALLLCSIGQPESVRAFADLVSGKTSPGGKLAQTYFDDPDEEYLRRVFYKSHGRNKVGPFMGYRYYDSSDDAVEYPFGFGLSYASFAYSGLSIADKEISFVVENTGKCKASEVVQIYIGKQDSRLARPKKELKSFFRIDLEPKEKKKIRVTDLSLEVFDEAQGRFLTESGDYQVYVGASLSDVRLTGTLRVSGETLSVKQEKLSDYLQSKSNILSDEYTLEAGFSQMKTYNKWKIAGIATIVASILLGVLFVWNSLPAGALVIPLAGLIAGGVLLAITSRKRKQYLADLKAEQEKSAQSLFADAEVVDAGAIEELFAEEFDALAQEQAEEGAMSISSDVFRRVNQDLTLPQVCEQMNAFAKACGLDMSSEATGRILSAMASSRLMLTDTLHGADFDKLARMMSEYFASPYFCETVGERHLEGGKLFVVKGEKNKPVQTALAKAIDYAKEHSETLCIISLKNIHFSDASKLLTPFMRYVSNPVRESGIYVQENNTTYVIPENLWFLAEIVRDNKNEVIPSYVAEASTLLRLDFAECKANAEKKEHQSVGYYDLDYVFGMCRRQFSVKEDLWKKVDALEAYVNAHTPYHIGNKLWLQLETYISVYCTCGHEKLDALDHAMAFDLLPVLLSVLSGKLTTDDKTVLEILEQHFGEDNVAVCRTMLSDDASNG